MMDARVAAAKVLGQLSRQQGSLGSLLPDAQAQVAANEQSFLQELCYGSARWWPRLNAIAQQLLEKPLREKDSDVHALLILGLYQLLYLRTPDHAAIGATVEAAKRLKKPWAAGLVNGVLRRYQREAETITARLNNKPEFLHAHPQWLIDAFYEAWPTQAEAIFIANNQHPPFTLRVNRLKTNREQYLSELRGAGIEAVAGKFSTDAITLAKACAVDALPGFRDGVVSVQDEAPQLCADLLQLQPGLRVLDACSAPGGKTAHIAERETELEYLLGLDISATRLQRSADALARLQLAAELRVGDAAQPGSWLKPDEIQSFDRILVDAPCSATGIIRRQPDIKMLRQSAQVTLLNQTQLAILRGLWPLLAPGGLLLYATCSILPVENAELIAQFIELTPDAQDQTIVADWGIAQSYGRQLLASENGPDGFYYALLRKAL